VFALAWIAYELICGSTLPTGSDLRSAMPAVAGVDRAAFAGALEAALSRDADARPPSSLAFAESLQAIVVASVEEPMPAATTNPEPSTPIWDADPGDEIPIHRAPPTIGVETAHEPVIREQASHPPPPPAREPVPAREYGYWFPVSATLAVGLLMGFASGYVVGQRERIPAPYSAERPRARSDGESAKPPAAAEAPPAPSGGRAYTESIVPPEGSAGESVAPPAAAPAPEPKPTETEPPAAAVNPSAPGVLQVESRPRGARVFLDGQVVGTTPVLVQDVRPGPHAVRIDLAGHRRWVTTIDMAPGARQRVAASLER
jgi:hypothetical protein